MPITLVAADHHPLILIGLEQLCSREEDLRVLARCADGHETLKAVHRHQPDILVLDFRMPHKDGLEVLREMRTAGLPTRVIFLTTALNNEKVMEAIRLGARGVVLKEMAPQFLIQCIRRVHAGGEWLETRAVGHILERMRRQQEAQTQCGTVGLTRRETEIARLVVQGLNNQAISKALSIGVGTIKVHLHSVYDKLNLDGRLSLLIYARDQWV
jgi:DNA-binding NarL/FixJ family response regulator